MPSLRFTCTYKPRKEGGRGSKMVLLLEARFSIVLSPKVKRKRKRACLCSCMCCSLLYFVWCKCGTDTQDSAACILLHSLSMHVSYELLALLN